MTWQATTRLGAGFTLALALFLSAAPALADAKEDAAEAYDKGAAAYDKGDYPLAATQLARADELAPNGVTLELALGAVLRADDPVLGMTLVERAEKRKGGKSLDKLVDAARRKFGARAGKLNVACRVESPVGDRQGQCEVKVDGKRFERGGARWVSVGVHDVVIDIGGALQKSEVTIEGGKTVELVPTAPVSSGEPKPPPQETKPPETKPEPPKPKPPAESDGISPTWFWVGLGATAVVGGVGLVSGLDTASKYDEFAKDRSNEEASSAGQSAQTRTIVLLAGTGVLAVATAAIGLFFVDWDSRAAPSSSSAGAGRPRFTLKKAGLRF
jgi:hypothetical protein